MARTFAIAILYSSFCSRLLSLSGDISLNPGPEQDFSPCSMCGEPVLDSHKAVCCDLCDLWVHVDCDRALSEELYDQLLTTSTSDSWFCSNCCVSVQHIPSTDHHGQSCLCLNARIILSKCHDLFAYISSFSVDIVAVTETFLDSSVLDAEVCLKNYVIFRKDRTRHRGGVLMIV